MTPTANTPIPHRPLLGVTVAIVAPSGYAPDQSAVERATARLEAYGCRVRNFYDGEAKFQRFGGKDSARVAQLHAAAADPDVQLVLALRGGYGMSRLLPDIDFSLLASSGKLFAGHSDFTALQMGLLARTGAASFASPMICSDFSCEEPSDFTLQDFWQCVTAKTHTVRFNSCDSPAIDVSGTLWGGNLTMLTHLIGTPWMPRINDGVLFIEDVNEHPYRIERMLLQLFHAGLLRQKAIVFGDFSSYRLSDYDNGYDFPAMLDYLRGRLGVPVLTGLPFGHMRDKVTLVVGSEGRLQSDGNACLLTMNGYPVLARAD
jgi:muramoyltetrapeptide carboxypeptidase